MCYNINIMMQENVEKLQHFNHKDKGDIKENEEVLRMDKYKDLETKEIMAFIQSGKDTLIEPWAFIEILSLEEKDREKAERLYEEYKNKRIEQELIEELGVYEERLEKAIQKNDKDAIAFFRVQKEEALKELRALVKDDDKINSILELPYKAKNLLSYLNKKNIEENYFRADKRNEVENKIINLIDNNWAEKKCYEIAPNLSILEEIKYYRSPEIIRYKELDNEGNEIEILEEKKRGEVQECELILRYNDKEVNLKEFFGLNNWKFVHTDIFQCFYPKKEIHYRDPTNIFKLFALFHEIGHAIDWDKNGEKYHNALKENKKKIYELKIRAQVLKELSEEEFSNLLDRLNEESDLIAAETEIKANEEIKILIKRLIDGNYLPREMFSDDSLNKLIEVQLYNKKPITQVEKEIYYSPYLNKKIIKEK